MMTSPVGLNRTSGRFETIAPAGGGLVLLDRRTYAASTTWSKPADGAGNLLVGVGKLVVVRQQGGGGGGGANGIGNGGSGGTTSFGAYANATGGSGGSSNGSNVGNGGTGSLRPGRCGMLTPRPKDDYSQVAGGGDGSRIGAASVRGGGGYAEGAGLNSTPVSSGGEGGESLDVFKIGDLTSTVSITIGAAGSAPGSASTAGGPGWMIVEVWGVLS